MENCRKRPHLKGYARVIDNYINYAQSAIDEFSDPKKLLQIAISVDILDTGIDVPEVSRQIYFVNQIVEFIVHNGMMKDLSVLQETPFTDQGSIVEVFTDLSVWMEIRKVIEQVNANAVAA